MGKIKDITGQRFGRLVVLKLDHIEKGKDRHSCWLCKCDCGNKKVINKTSLIGGKTKSCGCLRDEALKKSYVKKFVNLNGKIIGRLTIIERGSDYISPNGYKRIQWLCKCECGNIKLISSSSLLSGNCKSCGCYQKDNIIKNVTLEFGRAAFNSIYATYKIDAEKRNLEFELSKLEFKEIIDRNCFYCNCSPSQIKKNIHNAGDYIYNGIDRVNNDKGYIIGNVVPCCIQCNKSKNNLTLDEFKIWIFNIYKNFIENENKCV
jgi:hypothetical protein